MEDSVVSNELEPREEMPEVSLTRAFGGKSLLRDLVETLVLTLVIFFAVNALTGRFYVRGSSMEPSLHSSQYLIVTKFSYWLGDPQRGDVVVFLPPNGASEDYIKRIIGLPGELVEAHDGAVWVDGYRLDEPYLASGVNYVGAWQLGAGEYFALGDNRSNSSDSHTWGPLPRKNIVGRAWVCYWPPQSWGLIPSYRFRTAQQSQAGE